MGLSPKGGFELWSAPITLLPGGSLEVPPTMTPRIFHSLVAVVIRVGLLLALVIMLMAENAQARPTFTQPGCTPAGAQSQFVPHWADLSN